MSYFRLVGSSLLNQFPFFVSSLIFSSMFRQWSRIAFSAYRQTIQEDRRVLVDRFEIKDIAVKVVGVGSVGTNCFVMLLMASEQDPLFIQVKQARTSVLEAYAGRGDCSLGLIDNFRLR